MEQKPALMLSLELCSSPSTWIEVHFDQWPSPKEVLEAKRRAESLREGVEALESADEERQKAIGQARNQVTYAEGEVARLQHQAKELTAQLERMPAKWVRRRAELEALIEAHPARVSAAERELQKQRADLEKTETGTRGSRKPQTRTRKGR